MANGRENRKLHGDKKECMKAFRKCAKIGFAKLNARITFALQFCPIV